MILFASTTQSQKNIEMSNVCPYTVEESYECSYCGLPKCSSSLQPQSQLASNNPQSLGFCLSCIHVPLQKENSLTRLWPILHRLSLMSMHTITSTRASLEFFTTLEDYWCGVACYMEPVEGGQNNRLKTMGHSVCGGVWWWGYRKHDFCNKCVYSYMIHLFSQVPISMSLTLHFLPPSLNVCLSWVSCNI